MELTLKDVYDGLSKRMDTVTDELVRIGRIADKIEEWEEITVRNGGNKEYSQPRQQFFQTMYDFTKPGGDVDKKIDSLRELQNQKIDALMPEQRNKTLNKRVDIYWKWTVRIATVIIASAIVIRAINWESILGK
jgi:hypothetical protein